MANYGRLYGQVSKELNEVDIFNRCSAAFFSSKCIHGFSSGKLNLNKVEILNFVFGLKLFRERKKKLLVRNTLMTLRREGRDINLHVNPTHKASRSAQISELHTL